MPNILVIGDNLESAYTPARHVLNDVLAESGIRHSDVHICDTRYAVSQIVRLRPNLVVACGTKAAAACVPDWQGTVQERRGYLWEGINGVKVLTTVHPEDAAKVWVPWRVLLSYDFKRAKDQSKYREIRRPTRRVDVVTSVESARRAIEVLAGARRLAIDIENYDSQRIACVGFAYERGKAIVFPAWALEHAARVLDSGVPKTFQNGQYDLYFLLTRCGIRVRNYTDDSLIAWHACYPELAGAAVDSSGKRKGTKRTHKSLAFLASLFTEDAWWKDYDFQTEEERYILNGRDCCITYDIMEQLDPLLDELDVRRIYQQMVSLIWPCIDMQARGFRIDDDLRRERIQLLEERIGEGERRLTELVLPLLEQVIDDLPEEVARLFRKRRVCECCRNASKKRLECWACAGFEKAPTKKQLKERGTPLTACQSCEGRGEFNWLEFNPRSVQQKCAVLYDVLKLPKRFNQGKLSTDEDALRGLLVHVA